MNLENLNLVELDVQEMQTIEGGNGLFRKVFEYIIIDLLYESAKAVVKEAAEGWREGMEECRSTCN